ncbi:MAG: class I ribonucleotide reductase maintenance protein YfaE [Candidatus Lightella neohaematopini]|nr:class I ribonucleotide reductase maintenance protein YfaE [Candidatus Lightella neohaematopini]MCV2531221.1 class I ribonucleotide reductase maintenance protein YfaE [Candidatus Lightella neohaematopini]
MIYKIYLHSSNIVLFSYKEHFSLLHTLEINNISIQYQCKSGQCSLCKLKLLIGKVRYLKTPMIFIQRYEILPCICIPITNITIQI